MHVFLLCIHCNYFGLIPATVISLHLYEYGHFVSLNAESKGQNDIAQYSELTTL
jgi:hypothetical protein